MLVVARESLPRSAQIALMSAPARSGCVAFVCLTVWGLTRLRERMQGLRSAGRRSPMFFVAAGLFRELGVAVVQRLRPPGRPGGIRTSPSRDVSRDFFRAGYSEESYDREG